MKYLLTSTLLFTLVLKLVLGNLWCEEKSDGTEVFKLIQFTDTHFGEAASNDNQSMIEMANLINYETPQLIVLSGDIVSGYAYDPSIPNWWPIQFDNAISPIIKSETPWAYTLGNHDDQGDYNRTQIIEYAMKQPYSLTQQGPTDIGGVSNYYLTVFNSANQPIVNIWFMDSLDTNCYNVQGYGCVEFSTVDWYQQTSEKLEQLYGRKVPGIVYIHIPLPEVLVLWNNFATAGTLEDTGVCCWSLNTGLFAVMKERGDIFSVWHGHDHDNDFYGIYHDITLGYGRKTGFGGYGPSPGLSRGTRVIEISCDVRSAQDLDWNTWVRQDDGSIMNIGNLTHNTAGNWAEWQFCCGSTGMAEKDHKIEELSPYWTQLNY